MPCEFYSTLRSLSALDIPVAEDSMRDIQIFNECLWPLKSRGTREDQAQQ
jgi:hypothetical protein